MTIGDGTYRAFLANVSYVYTVRMLPGKLIPIHLLFWTAGSFSENRKPRKKRIQCSFTTIDESSVWCFLKLYLSNFNTKLLSTVLDGTVNDSAQTQLSVWKLAHQLVYLILNHFGTARLYSSVFYIERRYFSLSFLAGRVFPLDKSVQICLHRFRLHPSNGSWNNGFRRERSTKILLIHVPRTVKRISPIEIGEICFMGTRLTYRVFLASSTASHSLRWK